MTGTVDLYWRIFEANFIWLLSSKISQLETLKLLEVLVKFVTFLYPKIYYNANRISMSFILRFTKMVLQYIKE